MWNNCELFGEFYFEKNWPFPLLLPQTAASTVTDTAETWWGWSAWRNTKTAAAPAPAPLPQTPGPRATAGVSTRPQTLTRPLQRDFTKAGFPSGSEEETFVFPQSNETENSSRSSSGSKNNTDDSKLSDRSTQTEPGVWTPERDKRGERLNFVVHGSPERRVRWTCSLSKII